MREGKKEEKGRKKEGKLFTTTGIKQGGKGVGGWGTNATTRCIYSAAGVWLKGSYSESVVACAEYLRLG